MTHGREFASASSDQFVDALALHFGEELLEALILSVDTTSGEDILDVSGRRVGVATDLEEEVSGDVTHFSFYAFISAGGEVREWCIRLTIQELEKWRKFEYGSHKSLSNDLVSIEHSKPRR